MDNQGNIFQYEYLNADLQKYILLRFLNILDFETLTSASLVSTKWRRMVQDLNRQLADVYFPYFKITQAEAREKNPLTLFKNEYEHYKDNPAFTHVSMSLILASLSGNINAIDAEQNDSVQQVAYGLALSNGHSCSLEKLTKEKQNNIVKSAFLHANEKGFCSVVESLFTMPGVNINASCQSEAFSLTAQNGHVPVMIYLLETINATISLEQKERAFSSACQHGHLPIVKYLLETVKADITIYCKKFSLKNAVYYGHLAVIQYLLETAGADFDKETKQLIFTDSAKFGHLLIVQYLLMTIGEDIEMHDKELAFRYAAANERFSIVQYLLDTIGTDIAIEHKHKAIQIMIQKNYDPNIIKQLNATIEEQSINNSMAFIPSFIWQYTPFKNTKNIDNQEDLSSRFKLQCTIF